jgi:hypothetical protein
MFNTRSRDLVARVKKPWREGENVMDDQPQVGRGRLTPRHLERMTRNFLHEYITGQSLDHAAVAEMLERIAADLRDEGDSLSRGKGESQGKVRGRTGCRAGK